MRSRPGSSRSAAAADEVKLRSVGKRGQFGIAVDASRLVDVADAERQTEIRRRLDFDARMRAKAGHRSGHGVEGRKNAANAGIVFQRVEAGIERDGCVLEVVAELHAFGIERAERAGLVEAAQAHGAAFIADKPAVRKIVARRGKAAGVAAAKAGKNAVGIGTLAGIQIAAEAEPARGPVSHRGGLGVGGSPAKAERRDEREAEAESD